MSPSTPDDATPTAPDHPIPAPATALAAEPGAGDVDLDLDLEEMTIQVARSGTSAVLDLDLPVDEPVASDAASGLGIDLDALAFDEHAQTQTLPAVHLRPGTTVTGPAPEARIPPAADPAPQAPPPKAPTPVAPAPKVKLAPPATAPVESGTGSKSAWMMAAVVGLVVAIALALWFWIS